jgi:hypothetical protein
MLALSSLAPPSPITSNLYLNTTHVLFPPFNFNFHSSPEITVIYSNVRFSRFLRLPGRFATHSSSRRRVRCTVQVTPPRSHACSTHGVRTRVCTSALPCAQSRRLVVVCAAPSSSFRSLVRSRSCPDHTRSQPSFAHAHAHPHTRHSTEPRTALSQWFRVHFSSFAGRLTERRIHGIRDLEKGELSAYVLGVLSSRASISHTETYIVRDKGRS